MTHQPPSSLIRLLGAAAVVALAARPAAAQLPSASASALGVGDNYTALARGYNAVAWNPAGLAMPGSPGFSLAIMPLLGWGKLRTARALDSRALEADSKETFVCAYLSFALLLGLGLHALLGWWWADPAAALAMFPLIVREGWEAVEAARDEEPHGH